MSYTNFWLRNEPRSIYYLGIPTCYSACNFLVYKYLISDFADRNGETITSPAIPSYNKFTVNF